MRSLVSSQIYILLHICALSTAIRGVVLNLALRLAHEYNPVHLSISDN